MVMLCMCISGVHDSKSIGKAERTGENEKDGSSCVSLVTHTSIVR